MKLQAATLFLIISSFAGVCWSQDDLECTDSFPCVRFCCFVKDNCNFDISELPEARSVDARFKILQGQPCNRVYALQPESYPEDFWSFKANGQVYLGERFITTDNYCLHEVRASKPTWRMMICYSDYEAAGSTGSMRRLGNSIFIATLLISSWRVRNLH